MPSDGPIAFSEAAADSFAWAQLLFWQVVPMPLDGPIAAAAAAANDFAWAHSFFQQVVPMPLDGPIAFAAEAADSTAWAHSFFGRCYRCLWVGPLHLQQQLPMASLRPILFFRQMLSMPSNGPIASATAAADSFAWAQYKF